MPKNSGLILFDYTDYRKFLSDYYAEQKKRNSSFSYRLFAQRAGYNSSGLFKDIVAGRTGIYRDLISKFARGLGLGKKEEAYFEAMVYFCQAGDVDERKRHFEEMLRLRDTKMYLLDANQYEFFSKWYYSAIRELLHCMDVRDDFRLLAKTLNPTITPDQAKSAIVLLERLLLIKKDPRGFYRPVDTIISTGDEVRVKALNINNFQLAMMDLAKAAIDRHKPDKRDISSLTVSISGETFGVMKARIQEFRKELLAMAEKSKDADRVYQLNLQFFPLSQTKEKQK